MKTNKKNNYFYGCTNDNFNFLLDFDLIWGLCIDVFEKKLFYKTYKHLDSINIYQVPSKVLIDINDKYITYCKNKINE